MPLLLLYLMSVTHAPGWSMPMITIDTWTYSSQGERIEVTGDDSLHQIWNDFNNETRIGYKVFKPDGTVIFPETMVSNDVWSAYPTSCLVNEDSVALFWREGAPAWYCLRDSTGSELIPTSLLFSDSYVNRPRVEVSADDQGRIHSTFEIPGGVCYAVFDPEVGELFRDTIPGSHQEISNICVDGDRVHIFYTAGYALPAYIQYDLRGNIVIPPTELIQGLVDLYPQSSVVVDCDGNFWCFFSCLRQSGSGYVLSLLKIDGETGSILWDKVVQTPDMVETNMNILRGLDGETLYLMWTANNSQAEYFICFSIIDKDGNFIEEPYPAYDYSDEEVQLLACLDATSNKFGDVFAVWSQGDVEVGGHWIVMGWLDHNWIGVDNSESSPINPDAVSLTCSSNPFVESVEFTVEGSSIPEQLLVYDASGRLVRTLEHSAVNLYFWDGCDSQGEEVSAGSYIIHTGTVTEHQVMRLVKLTM